MTPCNVCGAPIVRSEHAQWCAHVADQLRIERLSLELLSLLDEPELYSITQ